MNYRNYVTWCYGEIQGRSFGEGAAPADYQGTEHSALVAVAKRALNVVFCLLTSLRFYKITTQSLFEVWIACPMFLLIVERYSPNYGEFAWQTNVCPSLLQLALPARATSTDEDSVRRTQARETSLLGKMVHSFKSVWDALADTPEQAASLRVRAGLMRQITEVIEANGWTQVDASTQCGVTQPRINDLLHGRISRSSLDALVNMAAALGRPVRVELQRPTRKPLTPVRCSA